MVHDSTYTATRLYGTDTQRIKVRNDNDGEWLFFLWYKFVRATLNFADLQVQRFGLLLNAGGVGTSAAKSDAFENNVLSSDGIVDEG